MNKLPLTLLLATALLNTTLPARADDRTNPAPVKRNILIFVADGMRHDAVNPTDTPTMSLLREKGVHFTNSHSMFPTLTTPNAAAIATGHPPGDTGDFSNTIYAGFPNGPTFLAGLESNPGIRGINERFDHNFTGEITLLNAARHAGFHTAAIGKYGPILIQDVTQFNADTTPTTIVLNDATGTNAGVPLPDAIRSALEKSGLSPTPPGTAVPNTRQQAWFLRAAQEVVLPAFIHDPANDQPFVIVYWSRDPDMSQHNTADNLNRQTRDFDRLGVGINGPSSRAGIKNADNNLAALYNYLTTTDDPHHPGTKLIANTDIFITSDHGFSTLSRHDLPPGQTLEDFSHTFQSRSFATAASENPTQDAPTGFLPEGFLALDIADHFKLPIFDAVTTTHRVLPANNQDGLLQYIPIDPTQPPVRNQHLQHPNGSALLGGPGTAIVTLGPQHQLLGKLDPATRLLVVASGNSDLIYFPNLSPLPKDAKPTPDDRAFAQDLVAFLGSQSTVAAIFIDTNLFGPIPGALPLTDVNLKGSAKTPCPALIVSFTTFSMDPKNPTYTGVSIADTGLGEGQGMHGSFGRQNTFNNMIAFGPDFTPLQDSDPVSNADIAPTIAYLLGLKVGGSGDFAGRVIEEALATSPHPATLHGSTRTTTASDPTPTGFHTDLHLQTLEDSTGKKYRYYDSAGMPGRTITGE